MHIRLTLGAPRCSRGGHGRLSCPGERWWLGTHHGTIAPQHLDYYIDEFTFRFNRRTSHRRGKLFYRLVQQALQVDPVPWHEVARRQGVPNHNEWVSLERTGYALYSILHPRPQSGRGSSACIIPADSRSDMVLGARLRFGRRSGSRRGRTASPGGLPPCRMMAGNGPPEPGVKIPMSSESSEEGPIVRQDGSRIRPAPPRSAVLSIALVPRLRADGRPLDDGSLGKGCRAPADILGSRPPTPKPNPGSVSTTDSWHSPGSTERVERFEKRKTKKIRVSRIDAPHTMFPHQNGGVGVMHQVAR